MGDTVAGLTYGQATGMALGGLTPGGGGTTWDLIGEFFTSPINDIWNSAAKVSPAQKQDLIDQETESLQQAGSGLASAASQAADDVTQALTDANADPSQAPDWVTTLLYVVIGGMLLLVLGVFINIKEAL